jgi:energy-coupling factor transporter ATP-binding protein EcfA2
VSLALHPGEFVVLVGANGSGKTTLLARHLNAVLSPTRGEVRVAGPVTCHPSNWPATRSQVAIIFQRPEDQMLRAGQQQKLAIAGDLAMRPRCLVLDEATAMWDPAGRRDLLALLRKLRQEGMTIISITHRMSEVTESERDIALTDGRVAFDGAPRQLFAHRDWVASLGVEFPTGGTLVMRGYIPGTVRPDHRGGPLAAGGGRRGCHHCRLRRHVVAGRAPPRQGQHVRRPRCSWR